MSSLLLMGQWGEAGFLLSEAPVLLGTWTCSFQKLKGAAGYLGESRFHRGRVDSSFYGT